MVPSSFSLCASACFFAACWMTFRVRSTSCFSFVDASSVIFFFSVSCFSVACFKALACSALRAAFIFSSSCACCFFSSSVAAASEAFCWSPLGCESLPFAFISASILALVSASAVVLTFSNSAARAAATFFLKFWSCKAAACLSFFISSACLTLRASNSEVLPSPAGVLGAVSGGALVAPCFSFAISAFNALVSRSCSCFNCAFRVSISWPFELEAAALSPPLDLSKDFNWSTCCLSCSSLAFQSSCNCGTNDCLASIVVRSTPLRTSSLENMTNLSRSSSVFCNLSVN
mmetsp:Transcript_6990/g.16349  ORF Transcript_6990/g.16349 Transcript_6990/m.16349 type:complete len:289 (-) Transcript_6990:149-1015(-)